MVSETNGASQVQAAAERLSLISLVPMATVLVQDLFAQYCSPPAEDELWLDAIEAKKRRKAAKPTKEHSG